MTNPNELRETLDVLKKARAILAVSYIRFARFDGRGGHCSLGALDKANGYYCGMADKDAPEVKSLCETAKALHPECRNHHCDRPGVGYDYFDELPIVFVNNHLGKEETLRVWDATIAELELRVAALENAEAPAEQPVLVAR